jgi:hypothetical protein
LTTKEKKTVQNNISSFQPASVLQSDAIPASRPWLMLISRSGLFLLFQLLIALVLALTGTTSAWNESARWWPFIAIFANFVSIYLLVRVFNAEGKRYLDIIRFSRSTLKKDLLWFFGASIIGLPIVSAPMTFLGRAIFGDPMIPTYMMFRSLPAWALIVSLLFPLTVAFAELPTYFGYSMPRIAAQLKNGWIAWLIASFFLSAQHMFLPLIPDGRFMLWRLLMYMPFAVFAGFFLKLRPTLLPYFMIVHALADFSAVAVYLMI